jgi:hypothetical protein
LRWMIVPMAFLKEIGDCNKNSGNGKLKKQWWRRRQLPKYY